MLVVYAPILTLLIKDLLWTHLAAYHLSKARPCSSIYYRSKTSICPQRIALRSEWGTASRRLSCDNVVGLAKCTGNVVSDLGYSALLDFARCHQIVLAVFLSRWSRFSTTYACVIGRTLIGTCFKREKVQTLQIPLRPEVGIEWPSGRGKRLLRTTAQVR